jgi:hypothetical protein
MVALRSLEDTFCKAALAQFNLGAREYNATAEVNACGLGEIASAQS